jgi:post-segregation antitoxin (ccd killing protein)
MRTTLYMDRATVEAAKAMGINLSQFCENCLKHATRHMHTFYTKNTTANASEADVIRNTKYRRKKQEINRCGRRDLNPGGKLGRLQSSTRLDHSRLHCDDYLGCGVRI